METFKVTKEDLRQEPVPPGFYKALINDGKFKMSSTGKPMVVVEYVLQSQSNETKAKTVGRKIFENLFGKFLFSGLNLERLFTGLTDPPAKSLGNNTINR